MNIFSAFTSLSLLPPIPYEVAGGLSGSSVKWMQRKCVTQQFSRELLSGKATILLAHSGIRLLFPQRWEEALYGWSCAAPQHGKGAACSFQQNLFQVERKVSSSSLLEVLPVKGEKNGLEIRRPQFSACLAHRYSAWLSPFLSFSLDASFSFDNRSLALAAARLHQLSLGSASLQYFSWWVGDTPFPLSTVKELHREILPSSEGGCWLSPCYLPLMDA